MKKILYIGNKLENKKSNISSIQVLGNLLHNEGFTMYYASSYTNKFLRLLDMVKSCINLSKKVDFVLIDTYSTTNFYYALIISQLCRILRVKYIPILHGGNLETRLIKNNKISELVFKNAYKLVAPSYFLKTVFENHNYSNVIYIPNSIEIYNYNFKNRSIETIKLLWVRAFAEIYNPEQAIFVLEALLKQGYDTELTMIGPDVDGSMTKVKNLANNKNLKVNFTGKLSKHEWIEISKENNIFINTTNFDNTPLSVIEAMALGIPVVSTNVGGLPFLISDSEDGLLVPPSDVNAMVKSIVKLKKDQDLKDKLVNTARHKVEQFDWKQVKPKWKALLS